MVIINEIVRKNYLKNIFLCFSSIYFLFLNDIWTKFLLPYIGYRGEGKSSIRETKTASFWIGDMFLAYLEKVSVRYEGV